MGLVVILDEVCKGCELCVSECKHNLLELAKSRLNSAGYHPIEYTDPDEDCTACRFCAIVCPDVAIRVYK